VVGSIDDPEHFAERCISLYSDEALWNRAHENSIASMHRYVAKHTIEGGLADVLAEVTLKRGRTYGSNIDRKNQEEPAQQQIAYS
jgi:hypothetical protein